MALQHQIGLEEQSSLTYSPDGEDKKYSKCLGLNILSWSLLKSCLFREPFPFLITLSKRTIPTDTLDPYTLLYFCPQYLLPLEIILYTCLLATSISQT